MRLDRFIAQTTEFSRSQAQKLLRAGRVSVNDQRVKQGATSVSETDVVCLDGEWLQAPQHRYIMLNKPEGVVCATEDGLHMTVLELLPEEYLYGNLGQLHPAGRLDVDTTGLVLLSDDGQWTHRITSPKYQCWKRYRVSLETPVEDQGAWIQAFQRGIKLHGEQQLTAPARLSFECDDEAIVEIHEGRYHQVKRMCPGQPGHCPAP